MLTVLQPLIGEQTACVGVTVCVVCGVFPLLSRALLAFAIAAFTLLLL